MKPDELDDDQWSRLLDGLALAKYSLVLGAGASMGSKSGSGLDLPTGFGVRDRLLAHYKIPGGSDQSLRSVYDLAQQVAQSRGEIPPKDLLAPWFSDCSVPNWYRDLVTIPWRAIWNLNIDDVLVGAYRRTFRAQARQELRVTSWRDPWQAIREPLDRVSVVHLHGEASRRDLVFGSLEYLSSVGAGGSAHRVFRDDWLTGVPTVVVGAALDDELDLAEPILTGLASAYPSVIVKPDFSEYDEFRLQQSGLIPVRMKASEFFAAVQVDWEDALARLNASVSGVVGVNPMLVAFMSSFRKPIATPDRRHDLYAGDEPTWADVDGNLDARRVLGTTVDSAAPFAASGLRVYAFHGDLSGTTTAELRFLRDAATAGFDVLEHEADGKFSASAVHWMAKQGKRQVLRISRLEDFADACAELERLCAASGAPVVVVTSLRTSRLERLKTRLSTALVPIEVRNRLRANEIDDLLAKLDINRRLNTILELSPQERVDFVRKTHHGSLVDSVAAITRGKSFVTRYEEAYTDLRDPEARRIFDVALITSEARYEVSLGVMARAAEVSASELRTQLSLAELGRLLKVTPAGISANHWGLAAQAARNLLSRDRRYKSTVGLALALAPYVSPTTITQRTREVALFARLMDAQRVVEAFGNDQGADLYQELEHAFDWNSRFWEQRALAELQSRVPRWERAEAWAREAVVRHQDGLSLNTLATVLLRRSTSASALDEDLFFEGLETVDAARRESLARVTEHPYMTAFHYLRLGRGLTSDASLKRRVDEVFNYWRLEVDQSQAWQQPSMRQDLDTEIDRYLRSAE